jgi:hypothetical protein
LHALRALAVTQVQQQRPLVLSGIRGNFKMLEVVFEHTERAWRRWLGRRCCKGYVTAEEFHEYHRKVFPLPKRRIIHNF